MLASISKWTNRLKEILHQVSLTLVVSEYATSKVDENQEEVGDHDAINRIRDDTAKHEAEGAAVNSLDHQDFEPT